MTVTLELPDDVIARLHREADRRGISLDDVVAELAALLPSPTTSNGSRKLGFIGIGASTSGRHAADADEILAEGFGRS